MAMNFCCLACVFLVNMLLVSRATIRLAVCYDQISAGQQVFRDTLPVKHVLLNARGSVVLTLALLELKAVWDVLVCEAKF